MRRLTYWYFSTVLYVVQYRTYHAQSQCAQLVQATATHLAAAAPVRWIGLLRIAPYPSRGTRRHGCAGIFWSMGRTVEQITTTTTTARTTTTTVLRSGNIRGVRYGNCSFWGSARRHRHDFSFKVPPFLQARSRGLPGWRWPRIPQECSGMLLLTALTALTALPSRGTAQRTGLEIEERRPSDLLPIVKSPVQADPCRLT
jgi:hypothetical protein